MLSVLAKIYSRIMDIRNYCYDRGIFKSYAAEIPVISIGNITAGGNAKTPLCITIVSELKARAKRPVILTRGYGGKEKGPYVVKGDEDAKRVGDEALLMQKRTGVPVVICPDRVKGAKFISANNLGDLIVLDDAFQHRRLKRSIDIVSIDVGSEKAVDDFLAAKVLPEGRFREDRDRALSRADVVVFAARRYYKNLPELDKSLLRVIPQGVPVFRSVLLPEKSVSLKDGGEFPPGPVVAFCGIAKPERFFDTLTEMGYTLLAKEAFNDHHTFSPRELDRLRQLYPNAKFVCTEKDAVKIPYAEDVYVLKTVTRILPTDAFFTYLFKCLNKNK